MKVWPVRWTREELAADAERSAALFRQQRLAVTTTWTTHYQQAADKFERLLTQLQPATPVLLSEQAIANLFHDGLGEALRYLAGPPISDDDLQVIAQVDSLSPGKLSNDSEALVRIRDVIVQVLDPNRFPWVAQGREPTSIKRLNNDAAVKAEYWLKQFGQAQVVPAAVLSGVFKVLNLEQSQQRGLALFWAHDLSRLGGFIESTR